MYSCPTCKREFERTSSGKTHARTCGRSEEIFWSQVDKGSSNIGCWLYRGTIGFEGYGYVNRGSRENRRQWQAHRFAWELLRGPIPSEWCLLHKCDVRNCVNPDHLYLGDRKDNNQDTIKRGRRRHRYQPIEELLWPELSRRLNAANSEEKP